MMSSVAPLLLKQRILAAIRGAFVADAASMGTHWIYDPSVMAKTVDNVDAPEFKLEPTPSFYSSKEFPGHYEKGMLSPYGEQMLFVTEYLATKKTVTGSDMSKAMLEWAGVFGGRPDHALTTFMENMKKEDGSGQWPNCGADDDQAHIYMKIVPVTCLYAGKPELQEKVTEAIKVHQNNEKAIAFGITASRILEAVLLGAPLDQALDTCQENIQIDHAVQRDAVVTAFARGKSEATSGKYETLNDLLLELSHEAMKDKPDSPFYDFAARSCALPGSFTGPVYQFYKFAANQPDPSTYLSAVRENIIAAGDTCSRAVFIGAVLAAASGEASPPQELIDQMDPVTYAKIDAAAQAIANTVEIGTSQA